MSKTDFLCQKWGGGGGGGSLLNRFLHIAGALVPINRDMRGIAVFLHTFFNVVPVDSDVLIPVKTSVFVVEANNMHHFMNHSTDVPASPSKRDDLLATLFASPK